jgi:hypothetical protein
MDDRKPDIFGAPDEIESLIGDRRDYRNSKAGQFSIMEKGRIYVRRLAELEKTYPFLSIKARFHDNIKPNVE